MRRPFFLKVIGGILPVLFSCSDSPPAVDFVEASLVVEFPERSAPQTQRLCLFLRTESDPRRAEAIVVRSPAAFQEFPLEWRVESPKSVEMQGMDFSVSALLSPPPGSPVPRGGYAVTYEDSAGNDVEAEFSVEYEDSLISAGAGDFPGILGKAEERLALYDADGRMVFLGKPSKNWKADSDIRKERKDAVFKRYVYYTEEQKIVCLMPVERLSEE